MGFMLQSGANFLFPLSPAILCYENTLFSTTGFTQRELWSLSELINWEKLWICIETFPKACRGANPTPKDGFHSSLAFLTPASCSCWMHTDSSCDRGFRFRKCGFVELLIPHCIWTLWDVFSIKDLSLCRVSWFLNVNAYLLLNHSVCLMSCVFI